MVFTRVLAISTRRVRLVRCLALANVIGKLRFKIFLFSYTISTYFFFQKRCQDKDIHECVSKNDVNKCTTYAIDCRKSL